MRHEEYGNYKADCVMLIVIPVVSVVAVLALVILVGAVYGYIKVFAAWKCLKV